MSDIFEVSSETVDFEMSTNIWHQLHQTKLDPTQSPFTDLLYSPINPIHEAIFGSVIFCVGLVLNALILRCYWSVKTSTAVYIRVLAWFDITALTTSLIIQVLLALLENNLVVILAELIIEGQFIVLSVFGPLFMALDRILIVAFPHSFKTHEKKMRIFKIVLATFQSSVTVLYFVFLGLFGTASLLPQVTLYAGSTTFWLECLASVFLYAVIVWKIRKSSRKVQPAYQTGNQ